MPGGIGLDEQIDGLAVADCAELDTRVVGGEKCALRFVEGEHDGGADEVAVAVPILDDAVIALAGIELDDGFVECFFEGGMGDSVEKNERAFDAVGIGVGAPLAAGALLIK